MTRAVVEGGTVTIGMGVRLSANYNSLNFDISASLPLLPGEQAVKGLKRVEDTVKAFFIQEAPEQTNFLQEFIDSIKKGRRA